MPAHFSEALGTALSLALPSQRQSKSIASSERGCQVSLSEVSFYLIIFLVAFLFFYFILFFLLFFVCFESKPFVFSSPSFHPLGSICSWSIQPFGVCLNFSSRLPLTWLLPTYCLQFQPCPDTYCCL